MIAIGHDVVDLAHHATISDEVSGSIASMPIDLKATIPAAYFRAAFAAEDDAVDSYLDAPGAISFRKWRSVARRDGYLGPHRVESHRAGDPEQMSADDFLAAFAMTPEQLDDLTRKGILESRGGEVSMESIRRFTALLMTRRLVVWTEPTQMCSALTGSPGSPSEL